MSSKVGAGDDAVAGMEDGFPVLPADAGGAEETDA